MYNVQCTIYNLQFTMYNLQFTMYNVQWNTNDKFKITNFKEEKERWNRF